MFEEDHSSCDIRQNGALPGPYGSYSLMSPYSVAFGNKQEQTKNWYILQFGLVFSIWSPLDISLYSYTESCFKYSCASVKQMPPFTKLGIMAGVALT